MLPARTAISMQIIVSNLPLRVDDLLLLLRQKLAARGVRGIVGLGRQFRVRLRGQIR